MNEDKNITRNGKKGGNLVGKPHKNKEGKDVGGIKAVVTDAGGRPVELEGGEVIINKEASKKHWKELSRINQSAGGGVPIEKPIDPHDEDPQEYAKGGKIQFNPNRLPNKWILKYAQNIKKNHPEIWKKGGNIYGNQAFKNLERVSERGYWLDSEEWFYIKWRSFVARHKGDFRIAGVVAMLKWVDKVDKGWQYMKNLIEDEIKKIDSKKSKGGWTVSKKQRMSNGGEVVIDESIAENQLSEPKVGMALITKVDENEPFPMVYYVLSIKKNDSGTIQSLRVGFKDESYTFGISLDDFMRTYIPATKKQVNFDNKSGATVVPDIFKKGGGVDTYKDKYNKRYGYKKGTSHDLKEIARDTGVSLKGIQQIYNKGIGAYKTNPQSVRPNVKSKEQWAYSRVYSSVMGGKAAEVDKKELKMAKGGSTYQGGGEIWYIMPKESNLDDYKLWGVSPLVAKITNSKGDKGFFGLYKLVGFSEKAFGNLTYWLVPFGVFRVVDEEKKTGTIDFITKKEDVWRFDTHWIPKNAWIKADNINFDEWNFTKDQLEKYKIKNDAETDEVINNATLKFQNSFEGGGEIKVIDNDEFILSLSKGDEFSILFDSSVKSGNKKRLSFRGKRRLKSGIVKYTFVDVGNKSGVKFYAYDRGNGLSFAQGDMAITNVRMEKISKQTEPIKQSKPKTQESYKVGDTGVYQGKQDKNVEITKITPKNVYFLERFGGKERRSEKKNFERLFIPDEFFAPPSSEKSEFIQKANEQIEKWEESGYKEESNEIDYSEIIKNSPLVDSYTKTREDYIIVKTMVELYNFAYDENQLRLGELEEMEEIVFKEWIEIKKLVNDRKR